MKIGENNFTAYRSIISLL